MLEWNMMDRRTVIFQLLRINCDEYRDWIAIRYVHELQNLFYALNGKELEIRREWL
jgi:hypothetical protein